MKHKIKWLKSLGFEEVIVPIEESGAPEEYRYLVIDLVKGFSLISNSYSKNNEKETEIFVFDCWEDIALSKEFLEVALKEFKSSAEM